VSRSSISSRASPYTLTSRAHRTDIDAQTFARRARGDDHGNARDADVVQALEDGVYDAFVVWAEARDDGHVALDITITTGAHKGDVVDVVMRAQSRDVMSFVGLPCTLVVRDGVPRVEFDV
jgi:hypothetical protein